MPYNRTYLSPTGKVHQIVVTDTNDVNCNFISRTVTNRDGDTVNVYDEETTVLDSKAKDICLLENPDSAGETCIEWDVSAADQTNSYLELPVDSNFMPTDLDMKCYASVYYNGRYYHLDNALPRDAYSCDRASSPNRLLFKAGVLREGKKAILTIRPKTT